MSVSLARLLSLVKQAHVETEAELRELIESGKTFFGYNSSLLYCAQHHGCDPSVTEHLLRLGANVNAMNDRGFTPLHAAVRDAMLPSVMILCEAGAALSIQYGPYVEFEGGSIFRWAWWIAKEIYLPRQPAAIAVLEYFLVEHNAPILHHMVSIPLQPLVTKVRTRVERCRVVCAIILCKRMRTHKDVARALSTLVWATRRQPVWDVRGDNKLAK